MEIIGEGLKRLGYDVLPVDPFVPRFPWFGPDLQTLYNSMRRARPVSFPREQFLVYLENGEALSVSLTRPMSQGLRYSRIINDEGGERAIALLHGLGGDEDSIYMNVATQYFSDSGWFVYRINLRGAGPSARFSDGPYHAGQTDDLNSALSAIADRHDGKLTGMGFSLGGQMLLRLLGELGDSAPLEAAFTVSAPLDLAECQRQLERFRNHFYNRYLTKNLTRQFAKTINGHKLNIKKIRTVRELDGQIIAPRFGFNDAEDYYSKVSCGPLLHNISVPTLAVHACDDPWIDHKDYRRLNWPKSTYAGAVLLKYGGHVGFHSAASPYPWYLQAAQKFFSHFLS